MSIHNRKTLSEVFKFLAATMALIGALLLCIRLLQVEVHAEDTPSTPSISFFEGPRAPIGIAGISLLLIGFGIGLTAVILDIGIEGIKTKLAKKFIHIDNKIRNNNYDNSQPGSLNKDIDQLDAGTDKMQQLLGRMKKLKPQYEKRTNRVD